MSTLQVSNLHFESTGNNRLQFTGSNAYNLVAGGTTVATVNTTAFNANGVFTVNNTDISPIGKHTIWIPAAAMYGRTTNGATSGTSETSTNKVMLKTLDFDTTTQEFAQFAIQMPKGWNEGALICQFVWSHPSTTVNFGVIWQIQAVAFADADGLDALAFGTARSVSDTGGATDTLYITDESANLTVAGTPGAEEWVAFQVMRNPAGANDTMAVDARLHGVKIHYTIDAAKDN